MTNHIMCVILFTYVTNNQNWTWSDEEKRLGNKQFTDFWCTCDHIGSTHFQVSKVEMPIAQLEIFHSNHCSMHFAQYFLDRHMFHFFMPVWKHCLVSANQKQAAIFQQWRSPYHIYIYISQRQFCLHRCHSPIRGFLTLPLWGLPQQEHCSQRLHLLYPWMGLTGELVFKLSTKRV